MTAAYETMTAENTVDDVAAREKVAGCQVRLLRPGAGEVIRPGGHIGGIGWVTGAEVSAIDIAIAVIPLGRARLVPSAAVFASLGGDPLPERATGFVFAGTLPTARAMAGETAGGAAERSGVLLHVRVNTASGVHDHAVALRLPASPEADPPGTDRPGTDRPGAAPVVPPPPARRMPAPPPPIRGVIEAARIDEHGLLRVVGWVASLSAIEELKVFIGARLVGGPQRDLRRDDVAAVHPDYPNAGHAGFLLQQEATDDDLAQTDVHVAVTAKGGIRRRFTAPLIRPAFAPGERLRRRAQDGIASLNCDEVFLSDRGRFAIKGWAICSSGVAGIDIELDGALLGTARAVEDRPDVGNHYPRFPGAPQAGFRFACDLAVSCAGDHMVQLIVRGHGGEESAMFQPVAVSTLPEVASEDAAVFRTQAAVLPAIADDDAIRCNLDSPQVRDGAALATVRGFLSINGWALGREKIERIDVFVDGRLLGRAHHGIRREDLEVAFPGRDALLGGFAMVIPPQVMKPGRHDVRVVVRDVAGWSREMAFSVQAEKAASGPGPWMLRRKLPQAEIDLQHAIIAQSAVARAPAMRWTLLLAAGAADADDVAATAETLRWQAYEGWRLLILAEDAEAVAAIGAVLAARGLPLGTPMGVNPIVGTPSGGTPSGGTPSGGMPLGRIAVVVRQPERLLAETLGVPFGDAARAAVSGTDDGSLEFLVPLGPGDRLGEDALLELSVERALVPAADFLYSDERRIDPADGEEKAFFKPDFSPNLLLSTNYIGRLWAASAALLRTTGLREGDVMRDAAGGYDAVLRLTERARCIRHVPKVLCATAQPRTRGRTGAERRALRAAMRRRGIAGELLAGPVRGSYRVRRSIGKGGKVSIIIPTTGACDLIRTAITSIREHTAWPDYEIICLDNIRSDDAPAERLACKAWIAGHADQVIEIAELFNWSRFNNHGARRASGRYLLFLNDDIEVLDPHWLHGLVEHAQRPEVGVVGPQLLYPDGRVQHAGVFLARHAARHAFRFYPRDEPGPFGLALTQRDVISVTGACMMMRRDIFDELGGFDERHAIVNNDLDFNLRVRRSGRSVVFTPAVSLVHHEMVSRASLPDTHDDRRFAADWADLFATGDPFFSRHFSPDYDDYLPDAEPVTTFVAGHPLIARDKVRKILAVKVDHIGDFITAFPAFRRIKEAFPNAELTVLAARASLGLAAMEPAIDRVIEFNFYHAQSEKGRLDVAEPEFAALADQLAPERFDLAIDLRRQSDTRPILQHTGARWLAGFESGYHYPWLDIAVEFEGDLALHRKRSHIVDSLTALIDAVSAQCASGRDVLCDPQRPVWRHREAHAETRRELAGLLQAMDIDVPAIGDGPAICMHTGAGSLNKQWPAASFAALIDLLAAAAERPQAAIMIIGGPEEAAFARDVIGRVRRQAAVIDLVGRTALRDLPAVLRAADLYVGNDSGPKHLAAALGVPTIGIHSGSVDAGEWGAVGPHALTIRRDMTCSPCYLARAEDCHRGLACLDGVRVGEVYRACRRLLALSWPAREAPERANRACGAVRPSDCTVVGNGQGEAFDVRVGSPGDLGPR